jgi:hypothetical protein
MGDEREAQVVKGPDADKRRRMAYWLRYLYAECAPFWADYSDAVLWASLLLCADRLEGATLSILEPPQPSSIPDKAPLQSSPPLGDPR